MKGYRHQTPVRWILYNTGPLIIHVVFDVNMVVPTSHSQLPLQDRRLQFISSRNGEDSRGFEVREAMQAFINLQSAELTAAVRADRSVVSLQPGRAEE